jgi:hypothetical protein
MYRIHRFRSAFCFLTIALWPVVGWAGTNAVSEHPPQVEPFDFATPQTLTGTIYEMGPPPEKILFHFRRTAIRMGDIVHVERIYTCPDGSAAAVENVVYQSGQLVSFEMKEFQANVSGSIEITPVPTNPACQKISIGYAHNLNPPKGTPKNLLPDTVIDDTLYPFMLAHWDDLMRGDAPKFHFVSLEWKCTFNFRLVKTGERVQAGRTFELIKMEPTSLLLSHVLKPLSFTVEKDGARHIVSYTGRTTPRVKKGNTWKYLDAKTVFDWK